MKRFCFSVLLLFVSLFAVASQRMYTISETELQTLEMEYQKLKERKLKALESVRKSQMELTESKKNSEMLKENLRMELAKTESLRISVKKYEEEVNSLRTDYDISCSKVSELELKVQKQRTLIIVLSAVIVMLLFILGVFIYLKVKILP